MQEPEKPCWQKGLCISFMESDNPVHVSVSVGKQIPLACTAAGKLYLSALTPEKLTETLNMGAGDLSALTSPDHEILKKQLDRIRQGRYCISIPEQRAFDELLNDMRRAMLPISEELSSLSL